ncbi:MAG: copper chaperone PCu(A)C [Rhizobiaceae bacterium]|nr:copper chaperone PCu(A)C [Rhizobiaceae bacterium]
MKRIALGLCAGLWTQPAIANMSAPSTIHTKAPVGAVIEHAEVVLAGEKDGKSIAYVSIWNGGPGARELVSLSVASFGSVQLYQTVYEGGEMRVRLMTGNVEIPMHAELLMKPTGVHLVLDKSRAEVFPGDSVTVTAKFADGSSVVADAVLLAAGSRITAHNHESQDGQTGG